MSFIAYILFLKATFLLTMANKVIFPGATHFEQILSNKSPGCKEPPSISLLKVYCIWYPISIIFFFLIVLSPGQHQSEFALPKHTAAGWTGEEFWEVFCTRSQTEPGLNCTQDNSKSRTRNSYQTGHGAGSMLVGRLLRPQTWFLLSFPHFPGHRDFLIRSATVVIGK